MAALEGPSPAPLMASEENNGSVSFVDRESRVVQLSRCCISGKNADGAATGSFISVAGATCYVARPPGAAAEQQQFPRAVVINTDVFGNTYINVQLLADAYAKALDAIVVVPDYFDNEPIDSSNMESLYEMTRAEAGVCTKCGLGCSLACNFCPWICKGKLKWESKIPMVTAVLRELRSRMGVRRLAMIGYCYGVPPTLRFCSQTSPDDFVFGLVDCGVTNHGEIKVLRDIEPLQRPVMFVCADKDWAFSDASRAQAQEYFEKRGDAAQYQFVHYPECMHGFAVRGDDSDETVRRGKQDAFQRTVGFISKRFNL